MTFPRLMETRAMCAINYVTVEWHDIPESLPLDVEAYDGTRVEIRSVAEGHAVKNRIVAELAALSAEPSCASHFTHKELDDESYFGAEPRSTINRAGGFHK